MILGEEKHVAKCLYFDMELCYNEYTDKLAPDKEMYDNGKKQDQYDSRRYAPYLTS